MELTELRLFKCVDCGRIQAPYASGGPLAECCDKGDLREFLTATVRPTWFAGVPNPKRATVDGPPTILWEQGRDAYGLYVGGVKVYEFECASRIGRSLPIGITNEILRRAYEAAS